MHGCIAVAGIYPTNHTVGTHVHRFRGSVHAVFDLSSWAAITATGPNGLLSPNMLGKPCVVSELSGEPAYRVYLHDSHNGRKPRVLTLWLTIPEMTRLGRLALKAREVRQLREKYGLFLEVLPDFYSEKGQALRPR